jgi:hypothetical protein
MDEIFLMIWKADQQGLQRGKSWIFVRKTFEILENLKYFE